MGIRDFFDLHLSKPPTWKPGQAHPDDVREAKEREAKRILEEQRTKVFRKEVGKLKIRDSSGKVIETTSLTKEDQYIWYGLMKDEYPISSKVFRNYLIKTEEGNLPNSLAFANYLRDLKFPGDDLMKDIIEDEALRAKVKAMAEGSF